MRRVARVDENQPRIVEALRAIGATVQPLHAIGQGCPDLLVGYKNNNYLIEIKDGEKVPSRRQLTVDQVKWHGSWMGQKAIACSLKQVLEILTEKGDAE